MPTEMKDIVVVLPGIMGSILQKDGKDLWNVSGQAIWQVVRSLGDRDVLEIPSFIAEAYGSLQNQPDILLNLLNKLQISQATGETLEDIRGRGDEKSRNIRAGQDGISLFLEDLYLNNEPIIIKAKANPDNSDFDSLKGLITCVSDRRPNVEINFVGNSDQWLSNSESLSLEPGLYRIQVSLEKKGKDSPNPVIVISNNNETLFRLNPSHSNK